MLHCVWNCAANISQKSAHRNNNSECITKHTYRCITCFSEIYCGLYVLLTSEVKTDWTGPLAYNKPQQPSVSASFWRLWIYKNGNLQMIYLEHWVPFIFFCNKTMFHNVPVFFSILYAGVIVANKMQWCIDIHIILLTVHTGTWWK